MNTSKIIKGVVNNGRYTVTAPIVKEDYGLYLQIEGVELPSTYEVDFSNSENSGSSVTMIGNSDGVLIPRQFISTGKDVFAFLYHVGADYGRTVYKFRIPNKLRPDRTNEEPTPEEQSVIDQCISALNEAVAQTAQDVESADQSVQSAQGYAEQAETARDTAQTSANNAQTSATSAQVSASQASASATASAQSASASAQSASEATQAKQDAQDSANEAKGYATQASNSADDAQGHANTAHGYATDASNSADTATAKATEASGYAQTASQKATEASGYADTSSQKASESAQSATSAQGYAQTAETAKMDAQTAQGLAESARDSAVSAKNDAEQAKADAESARDEAQTIVDGISGALDDKADIITDTASGAIASFPDGADGLPLKSLVVDINPVQDLSHGDPSPENICPISGWTEVTVCNDPKHGGAIQWNQNLNSSNAARSYEKFDVTFTAVSGKFAFATNGTFSYSSGDRNNYIMNQQSKDTLVAGHKYLFTNTSKYYCAYVYGAAIGGQTASVTGNVYNVSNQVGVIITCTASGGYRLSLHSGSNISNGTVMNETIYINMFDLTEMFGAGNEPTTVEQFKDMFSKDYYEYTSTPVETCVSAVNGDPYSKIVIQLGQTVYGGKLDVLSGVLTVDRAIVGMGTLNYFYVSSGNINAFRSNIGAMPVTDNIQQGITSIYPFAGTRFTSNMPNLSWMIDAQGRFFVRDDSYSDVTAFKTAVTGQTLVYKLAEPIEIQLSANQINSLYGVNNLWADSGDTEVVYRADTKLYIERLTAPDSADMIADANITSGKYFMVGNSLYKATANIANGAQIIVGTNCIRKSLSEALNEINA